MLENNRKSLSEEVAGLLTGLKYIVRVIDEGGVTQVVTKGSGDHLLSARKSDAQLFISLTQAVQMRDAMRKKFPSAWIAFVSRPAQRGLNYDDLGRRPV